MDESCFYSHKSINTINVLQQSTQLLDKKTGDRLTENQLIEIVFYQLIKIF